VSTMATLIPTVKMVDPELILFDLELSLSDPLDAVHLVHRSAPGIPLVVLADPAKKSYAAQSLSEGAMDYVLKGFMDARTLGRVERTALERNTFEGLADLLRDPLTGLYTREGLLTLGTRCHEEAHRRTGGALLLICALFENLQTLREGFGPGAGDTRSATWPRFLPAVVAAATSWRAWDTSNLRSWLSMPWRPVGRSCANAWKGISPFTTRRVRRGGRSICASAWEPGRRKTEGTSASSLMPWKRTCGGCARPKKCRLRFCTIPCEVERPKLERPKLKNDDSRRSLRNGPGGAAGPPRSS
jgi:CheY-like chemotaxis protein